MSALSWLAPVPLVVAQETASEFSRSMERHHAMGSSHSAQEIALVVIGAIIVVLTTAYTVRYFVRPGETGADHIKRRILDDERLEQQ